MTAPRLLHLADLETIYDDPERLGRLAGAIDRVRDDRTFVVGSGDTSALGALAFESDDGRAIARPFYDRIALDADTLGNHEFDHGASEAAEWARSTAATHLAANVEGPTSLEDTTQSDETDRWDGLESSTVVSAGGHRIGLIGVVHPETVELSGLELDVTITDPVDAVRIEAKRLRDRGADWVVVLSHAGPIDERIAAETDVDAVLGGHDHDAVRERIGDTLVSRTEGAQAGVYQLVELGGSPTDHAGSIEAVTRSIDEAPRSESVESTYRELATDLGLTSRLGRLPDPLDHIEAAELVATAYRVGGDADVGLVAAASVRDGLPGRVTRGDVVGIVPFGSKLDVHRLPGETLRAVAERCADPLDATHGGLIAAGLELRADGTVCIDGARIDPESDYRLGCMSYLTVVDAVPELEADTRVESRGPQHEHVLTRVANRIDEPAGGNAIR
ncbi:5'-nucleotidase/2',3'-cyclic phosphodiesterase-like hydrolase [Halovivax ruber XH-70]|uniref:5'-nucleotidase/2',3'-cyclic phosphodiesterase-like hydrolase n=1 Tax=Halovivax ruber (strain DSM 18193 / JCM 13892 / XH-70) TaxID=797302 RepID=L0IA81_HALRX|nr:5'-nucleotidase C-terminal domain-containing protein [Halovivax ruber]AGB15151.1 5'-nucleotidase/2',3'-cyclic phosphodiesterase-like hydrolase [Halovivax ruber XH-70]